MNGGDNNNVPAGGDIPLDPAATLEVLTAMMKQNKEKLTQLKAENASLRTKNASLVNENMGIDADARTIFRAHVILMQPLDETPPAMDTRSVLQQETCIP